MIMTYRMNRPDYRHHSLADMYRDDVRDIADRFARGFENALEAIEALDAIKELRDEIRADIKRAARSARKWTAKAESSLRRWNVRDDLYIRFAAKDTARRDELATIRDELTEALSYQRAVDLANRKEIAAWRADYERRKAEEAA